MSKHRIQARKIGDPSSKYAYGRSLDADIDEKNTRHESFKTAINEAIEKFNYSLEETLDAFGIIYQEQKRKLES